MCHNSCCLLDSELSAVTPLCQYSIFSSYSPLPVLLPFDTVCCLTVKQVINLPPTSCAGRQLSLYLFHKANCPTMKWWPSDTQHWQTVVWHEHSAKRQLSLSDCQQATVVNLHYIIYYHWWELPQAWFLLQQKFCRDQCVFVTTVVCLLQ